MGRPAAERREELIELYREVQQCQRCPLYATRTNVVFGSGNADADLMFVGEAPGFHEDQQGKPFVGAAGKLLDSLLNGIGLRRDDVFIANVLKCLRYNALVQLADGSWERIGRLVRSRYAGEVLSVDDRGRLVPRRVVGWHATPLGDRRVFRLSYRSAKNAGAGRVSIQLTEDHPVLTERGYVPVEELASGDRIATGQGLSQVARDVICGTLLGDGHINADSAHLSFSHSDRQAVYAAFKADILAELQPRYAEFQVAAVAGGPREYPVVQIRTLAHRALGVLRRDFYAPRKGVPAWIGDQLNARMLAFWFMDDGYMRIRRGGRRPMAEISTDAFSAADLQTLLRGLQRLGLSAKVTRNRLYFDVKGSEALSETIAPYVPECMRHKLDPGVASQVPFNPELTVPGPVEVLFDEVDVEDITECPRKDTTFFCIDVEQTHNFVTAGGVVHNCRPPGNRDPLPAEIDECKPYLARQVELIEPLVICTLGNFATKCLTRRQDGITRVHGRPQDHVIAGLPIRIYPIFHPAAGLRSTAMLETLRQDFQRLPELLEAARPQPEEDESNEPSEGSAEPVGASQLDLFA